MKKTLFLLPLFFFILLGCNKVNRLDQLLTFEISTSENIKIPASGLLSTPIISPVPVSVNSSQSFENNNTRADLVKDVRLSKLTLTIINPAEENFNFLKSIRIYISTVQNDKVLLASLDNVPTGASTIELIPANTKLDTYIKASSYTLDTEVAIRSTTSREFTVRADSKFKVTADPL